MKYYAVKKGRKTGIYTSWDECKSQVNGYKGALYKSFKTINEAKAYLKDEENSSLDQGLIAYVDGSFNAKKRIYGYGCVLIENNQIIEKLNGRGNDPTQTSMRNVAGEILGSQKAIEYAIAHHYDTIIIYYDYMGIEKWAKGEWKTNKKGTKEYAAKYNEYAKAIHVIFRKVQAHSGDTYNDMADQLAKEAVGII